eukprot:TRINITY_DN55578_c0_g1_i1.p1 TRINITY_DN55578_c0_g1~~TRINITY_DN55578_c0_g1_i1.p1  ORF type:complete len:488 (+),score=93.82 TRINITY_DN55578_c0_g1_i1:79-1464(+)
MDGPDLSTCAAAYGGQPFPPELRAVWRLATELCPGDPRRAFSDPLRLVLVGPFDVLSGCKEDPTMRWRWWYDPPEVITVAVEEGDGVDTACRRRAAREADVGRHRLLHWGYHRDDPKSLPTFVACAADRSYHYSVASDTLLGALAERAAALRATGLRKKLEAEAEKLALPLLSSKAAAKVRRKASLAQTVSGLGLVVPYDRKTEVGYREQSVTNAELRTLLDAANVGRLSADQRKELAELSTFADIANDECDYGHGLELGLDYLCLAKPGTTHAAEGMRLLDMAYNLLGRDEFRDTVGAISKWRRSVVTGSSSPAAAAAPEPAAERAPAPAAAAAAAPAAPAPAAAAPAAHAAAAPATGTAALGGCVVCLSGFVNPERGELRSMALRLGARFADDWGPEATHLVCAYASTPKRAQAEASGHGEVVAKTWLTSSAASGRRAAESSHRLGPARTAGRKRPWAP